MLDYGIVGNCKTCALVKKDASVDWMCFPTFSSQSIFARILDRNGGSIRVKPRGKHTVAQRYLPNTAILETTFTGSHWQFQVIDFFPRYHKLTKGHEKLVRRNRFIRLIKPIRGKPRITLAYDPRPGYAEHPVETTRDGHDYVSRAGKQHIGLCTNVAHESIEAGNPFELTQTKFLVVGDPDHCYTVKQCMRLLTATRKYWERWTDALVLPEENRDVIIRSAITLKLLTYSKTGAIIAAPTTSIPEEAGTTRAFDYRFCWVRDAAFCVDAFKKIGREYEPKRLLEFILKQVMKNDFAHIMYGINGETELAERTLDHLEGYRGSSPVRIGNAAFDQQQNDIYGEIIDVMYLYFGYYEYGKPSARYWRFLRWLVNQIKFLWKRKDSGIWEFRGKHDHYTFSKFMCFVGVDRAIKLAQHYGKEELVAEWLPLRDQIHEDVITKGYDHKRRSFMMAYGSAHLDAAALQMTYHEFLPKTDPRIINTVKAIYRDLRKGCLVQRYKCADDFGVSRSAFTICSFWLVDALYYIGEEQRARGIYSALVKRGNHLGLFSEDIDLVTGRLIGNFPQGYTHIALINSSILLSEWNVKRKRIDWSTIPRRNWF